MKKKIDLESIWWGSELAKRITLHDFKECGLLIIRKLEPEKGALGRANLVRACSPDEKLPSESILSILKDIIKHGSWKYLLEVCKKLESEKGKGEKKMIKEKWVKCYDCRSKIHNVRKWHLKKVV